MNRIHASLVPALAISSGTALADPVFSRDDLGADDNIQWGQFGPPNTAFDTPAGGFTDNGLTFTVDDPDNHRLARFDQGDGWDGNFSPGDELIFNSLFGTPIIMEFDQPVFGVGANIQGSFFGRFTGVIEVFDMDGTLIERFSREGESNDNADGSAIFIGIVSDTPIARATFAVDTEIAINMVGLVTIPAPSSLTLLAVGGLACRRRRGPDARGHRRKP